MTKTITKLLLNWENYEIREYQESTPWYTWDFSQWYDWWSVATGWFAYWANWINWTTNGWNTMYNPNIDISWSSHITFKMKFMSTNVWSRTGTAILGFQYNPYDIGSYLFRVYNWLMTNSWYECRFYDISWADTNLWDVSWTSNAWYMWVMDVDINNWTATWTYKIYENDETGTLKDTFNISWDISWAVSPVLIIERDYVYISNAELILS